MKRKDYINWDEYFMGIALLSSQRSKDPSTQVGACIVNDYNGAPTGYDDDKFMTWERDGKFLDTKYAYVCHGELNAILNAPTSVKGCRLYVALFPCNECAKAIIQSGIKEVIYMSDKYDGTDSVVASKKMLDACGVIYRKYNLTGKEITLKL